MSANYDITSDQGSDFNLHLSYYDENDNPIDLQTYNAELQVRRSYGMTGILAFVTSNPFGATVGGTGSFGGITMNCNYNGATGYTGGILLTITGTGLENMPVGKFVYDLRIVGATSGNVTRVIEGRWDSLPQVTR